MPERVLVAMVLWMSATLGGCAIAARSDKFGADLDFGLGGILGYIADVHLKVSVGFMKSFPDKKKEAVDEGQTEGAGDSDPAGLDHFL
jgi:hypothetical protein